MKEAKKELGKAFLNLANMILVVYLLGKYLSNSNFSFWIVFLIVYIIVSLYFASFYLIKEASDE